MTSDGSAEEQQSTAGDARRAFDDIPQLGGRFYTEHDLGGVGFRALGTGVKIHSRASIYGVENIAIGNHVRIDDFTVLIATGRVDLGDYVNMACFCYLGATHGIVMEEFVTLAPGVKLFTSSDDYGGSMLTGSMLPKEYTGGRKGPIHLQRHVIIGAGSVVLPACTLREGSSVGALSLVASSLDEWGVYAGIPVRRLRDRKRDLLQLERRLKA